MITASFFSPAPVVAALVLIAGAAARGTWSPCGLSMISAINPFSEQSRGHRYWGTAVWFVLGSVAGGAILGGIGALGAVGVRSVGLPSGMVMALAAGCCLVAAAGDTDAVPIRLPLVPRQVDERWLAGYRRWCYAIGFGAQIGFGLCTYVMTAAVYLVPVLGALSGSPVLALGGGLVFGSVRGLAILLTAPVRTPAQLRALHRRLAGWASRSLQVVLVLELGTAVIFSASIGVVGGAAVVGLIVATLVRSRRADAGRPVGSSPAGR